MARLPEAPSLAAQGMLGQTEARWALNHGHLIHSFQHFLGHLPRPYSEPITDPLGPRRPEFEVSTLTTSLARFLHLSKPSFLSLKTR